MRKSLKDIIAELPPDQRERVEARAKVLIALERARQLRRAKRLLGVDAIYQFVSDVDGDWLERWIDE